MTSATSIATYRNEPNEKIKGIVKLRLKFDTKYKEE